MRYYLVNDFDNDKEIQVFQESLLMTLELFDTFQSVWNDSQVIIFGSNYPVWASFNNSHHPWAQTTCLQPGDIVS